MGALDGFRSTWSNARDTFGQGPPQTGEQYDKSGQLPHLHTTVESAAPGSRWSGTAAGTYDRANTDHGKVFGQLAGLDQQLSAKVTQSAQVVDQGRRNLDVVRRWVENAAESVPEGKNREQTVMKIVSTVLGQMTDIIEKSNADLNKIGGEIRGLGAGYDELKKQNFGLKEDKPDVLGGRFSAS